MNKSAKWISKSHGLSPLSKLLKIPRLSEELFKRGEVALRNSLPKCLTGRGRLKKHFNKSRWSFFRHYSSDRKRLAELKVKLNGKGCDVALIHRINVIETFQRSIKLFTLDEYLVQVGGRLNINPHSTIIRAGNNQPPDDGGVFREGYRHHLCNRDADRTWEIAHAKNRPSQVVTRQGNPLNKNSLASVKRYKRPNAILGGLC